MNIKNACADGKEALTPDIINGLAQLTHTNQQSVS